MGVKLEEKHIMKKLRGTFGDMEVYNPIDGDVYKGLYDMIQENSKQVKLEDGNYDIEVENLINIMRFMLINLTNIESKEYWENFDNDELNSVLKLADGDFKDVINDLLKLLIKIGKDVKEQTSMQLMVLANKIEEFTEVMSYTKEIHDNMEKIEMTKGLLDKLEEEIAQIKENSISEEVKE